MNLKGTHIVKAPRAQVWEQLNDHTVLAKLTPGVKSLEPTGPDSYKAVFEIKLGPVNGTFTGDLHVIDKIPGEGYTLDVTVHSPMGHVKAKGKIRLKDVPEGTEVQFSGDAQISGLLARTGQRVLSGVGQSYTHQFFKALEDHSKD